MSKKFNIKNMLNCFPQIEVEKYIYNILEENKQLQQELEKYKNIVEKMQQLEIYHQKGGTYVIPVEIINDLLGQIEELEKGE